MLYVKFVNIEFTSTTEQFQYFGKLTYLGFLSFKFRSRIQLVGILESRMLFLLTSALCLVFLGFLPKILGVGCGRFGRGTGKGKEFRETEVGENKMGNLLMRGLLVCLLFFYVFVKFMSKPLYCDYVAVSLSCCVHYCCVRKVLFTWNTSVLTRTFSR